MKKDKEKVEGYVPQFAESPKETRTPMAQERERIMNDSTLTPEQKDSAIIADEKARAKKFEEQLRAEQIRKKLFNGELFK